MRILHVLLSSELSAERKKTVLQNEYGIAMSQKLREELSQMCNLSDGVFEDGINQQKRRSAVIMLKDGLSDKTVVRYSGLSLEEVRKLRQELVLA